MSRVWLTHPKHTLVHFVLYIKHDLKIKSILTILLYFHTVLLLYTENRIVRQKEGFSVEGSSWFSNPKVTFKQRGVQSVTIVPKHWISTPTWSSPWEKLSLYVTDRGRGGTGEEVKGRNYSGGNRKPKGEERVCNIWRGNNWNIYGSVMGCITTGRSIQLIWSLFTAESNATELHLESVGSAFGVCVKTKPDLSSTAMHCVHTNMSSTMSGFH